MRNISASELLALLATISALVGGLWKAFDAIAKMREQIREGFHRIELLHQAMEFARDEIKSGLKGIEDVADHVRERTRSDTKELSGRVGDIERFLVKTTEFEVRDS